MNYPETHLTQAERHVRETEAHIARHREILTELEEISTPGLRNSPCRRCGRRGARRSALADRTAADRAPDPQPPTQHRSAVPPGRHEPRRRTMTSIVTTTYRYKRPPPSAWE